VCSASDAAALGIAYPYPGFCATLASALRPYPQVQGSSVVTDYGAPLGFSTHEALQATVNREFQNGLSVYANYTRSKTLANVQSSLAPGNGDNANRPMDYYNLRLEKAPAEYDQPNAFKAHIAYQIPFHGRHRLQEIFGNWSVSGILNYFSGTPLGFTAPSPLSGSWNGAVNRPNIAAGNPINPSFKSANFDMSNTSKSAADDYLNRSLLSAPASLTLGTAARLYSIVRGFPTKNEDLAIQKSVFVTEKVRVQLRGEFLNGFNRHALSISQTTSVTSGSFGQATGVSGNRQIQISARFDF
jgi:hypothetical protein